MACGSVAGDHLRLRGEFDLRWTHEAIDATIALLKADPRFAGMEVKYSYADFCPFPKFKVKKKPELLLRGRRRPTLRRGHYRRREELIKTRV